MEKEIRALQECLVVFFEALEGFAAVEADGMDFWIFLEQGRKVVALLVLYVGVKAARPVAGSDGVPEGDVMAEQHGEAFLIGGRRGRKVFQNPCHEGPETVLGMGIVLLCRQRGDARHGAEDEMGTVFVDAWREADAMGR